MYRTLGGSRGFSPDTGGKEGQMGLAVKRTEDCHRIQDITSSKKRKSSHHVKMDNRIMLKTNKNNQPSAPNTIIYGNNIVIYKKKKKTNPDWVFQLIRVSSLYAKVAGFDPWPGHTQEAINE